MSELKYSYQNLSDEELLKRRALGEDGLSAEAHRVIEEILKERGIEVPAIPSKSINTKELEGNSRKKMAIFLGIPISLSVYFALMGLIRSSTKGNFFGVSVAILIFTYFIYRKIRNSKKSKEQQLEDKLNDDESFTELMYCSVKGDLLRTKELVSYGADVNAQDIKGTTALMYAVSNAQVDIVKYLLANGADKALKTEKNNTVFWFAEKSGNEIIKDLLSK